MSKIRKIKKVKAKHFDYIAYFDGATVPFNPGGACGMGVYITDGTNDLFEHSDYIPMHPLNSNNVAEYLAFTSAIKWFLNNAEEGKSIKIYGDSMLVVKQMQGYWGIKGGMYKEYALEAQEHLSKLKSRNRVYIEWIPREENIYADDLSKRELSNHELEISPNPRYAVRRY
jgi:ribonuclease HI